jgi:hypothetical protein
MCVDTGDNDDDDDDDDNYNNNKVFVHHKVGVRGA